jgi:hypothetical protein
MINNTESISVMVPLDQTVPIAIEISVFTKLQLKELLDIYHWHYSIYLTCALILLNETCVIPK